MKFRPLTWTAIMLAFLLPCAGRAVQTNSAADFANHWAFTPPIKPALPHVQNPKWVRNPIDGFILARLDKEKLQPAKEADKITLLRRLSLDLTGLPPTIAEVDAFLADTRPDAYHRQVERLLASPHYGERWGRHWLDAARYADSDGFEKDMSREVWFYRDWVINAFNHDLPYNEFIIEQIAGDQLPHATQDQIVATGYLRNSMLNQEGAIEPEQFRMEEMFDRMDAIGKGILGLTIQCAQCHNHKFDPLTQEEYYRMFAFINNDDEAQRAVYTPDELMQCENIRGEITRIEAGLRQQQPDWQKRMADWKNQVTASETKWTVLDPDEFLDPGGSTKYAKLEDHSILCAGYAPTKMTTRVKARTTLTNITAIRLEVLTDPNLPLSGPGRSINGTFGLTEFRAEVAPLDRSVKETKLKFSHATADYSQPETPLAAIFDDKSGKKRVVGSIDFAIDGDANTAWGIDAGPGRRNVDRKAVFELATNVTSKSGVELTLQIEQNHGGWNSDDHQNNLIGRMRFSVTCAALPVSADPLPKNVRDLLAIPANQRSPAQRAAIFSYYRTTVPEFAEANAKIEKLLDQWPAGHSTLTLAARSKPRATHILKRGDSMNPEGKVTAGVPAFLNQLPKDAPLTRLSFARWLVDPKSPTTARAFVNRVWQQYFGIGIVDTPEDFGMRADAPSHQQLLDWLACEFMDSGWSVKKLQRLIVESATYRQSSRVTPELYTRDQFNTLLARGPRFRVDGETVRDIALEASGLLTPTVGGPSVFSPAPQFLFVPPASYAPFTWKEETGPERYRRALYTFRRRTTPYPVLQTFDTPNGESSCIRRTRSDTPLQALTTLNETVFVECAQALALRTLTEGGTNDQSRAAYVFRRCVARKPTATEVNELLSLLQKEQQRIADGWLDPKLIADHDPAHPPTLPAGATPTQLAAWTMVSRVILNLDETITKE